MPKPPTNLDITIRGGLINVPDLTKPTQPPRHQPDTPRTKKQTKTRPDHIPAPTPDEPTTDQPAPDQPEVTKNGTAPPS